MRGGGMSQKREKQKMFKSIPIGMVAYSRNCMGKPQLRTIYLPVERCAEASVDKNTRPARSRNWAETQASRWPMAAVAAGRHGSEPVRALSLASLGGEQ